MSIIEIECPSGLKGKVRNLTGKDGRYLSDRQVMQAGATIDYILKNCWVETIDSGPYKTTDSGLDWSKVLQGDRMWALLQIRIATHGEMYPFKAQCANKLCAHRRFEWEIDLEDLPVRELPKHSRLLLEGGENKFEARVPGTEEFRQLTEKEKADALMGPMKMNGKAPKNIVIPDTGKKIFFSLPVGADEEKMKKRERERKKKGKQADTNEMLDAIQMRIIEIEGVEPGKRNEGITEYLEELSLADLAALLDRFDDADCGVETTIEIECPECSTIQEVDLPFDSAFFFPRKGSAEIISA